MRTRIAVLFLTAISVRAQQASLAGVVQDKAGLPLQTALVVLERPGGPQIETRTDGQGFYSFSALSGGEYTLRFFLSGFRRLTGKLHLDDAEQKALPAFTLDVGGGCANLTSIEYYRVLPADESLGKISGTIKRDTDRASPPAAGVTVVLFCPDSKKCADSATTAANGEFSFERLAPRSSYRLRIDGGEGGFLLPNIDLLVHAGLESHYSFALDHSAEEKKFAQKTTFNGVTSYVYVCE